MRFKEFLGEAWPRRGQKDFLVVYHIGGRRGRRKFYSYDRAVKEFEACKRDPQVTSVFVFGGKPGRLVDDPLMSWKREKKGGEVKEAEENRWIPGVGWERFELTNAHLRFLRRVAREGETRSFAGVHGVRRDLVQHGYIEEKGHSGQWFKLSITEKGKQALG